jgi:hypothetical protein
MTRELGNATFSPDRRTPPIPCNGPRCLARPWKYSFFATYRPEFEWYDAT